jgi:D-serine deaminase-like pyridoxal phosphate-dependent protein
MNRTGIIPNEKAFKLYKNLEKLTPLKFMGLHAYDGHIRSESEIKRKEKSDAAFLPVIHLREKIENHNKKSIDIIAGGSLTFLPHSKRKNVFLSPGTTLLWDTISDKLWPESPFQIAAVVATRIISKPNKDILCLDLGHKAIAPEMPLPRAILIGLEEAEHIGQSEEHLIIKTKEALKYDVGDMIYALPKHICPTVVKYNQSQLIKNHKLIGYWDIQARDYNYMPTL